MLCLVMEEEEEEADAYDAIGAQQSILYHTNISYMMLSLCNSRAD